MPDDKPDNDDPGRRCGFIALVGAPNAGKSTLLNTLIGAKIAIVSPRVQTTRTTVRGVVTEGPAQLVFIDTPGIFQPKRRLERAMVARAWQGATDADLIVLIVDAARAVRGGIDVDTARIIDGLKSGGRRAILAINKIDLVPRPKLLALAQLLNAAGLFTDTFMIAASKGDGVADLRDFLASSAPVGPWHYPEDQLSDMSERLIAAEMTREALFCQLRQELPYSLTVETESWDSRDDGSVRVEQTIYVQRDTQKAIVLGKGGARIKAVGAAARKDLETILGHRVHLFLFVKVREGWIDDPERYAPWDLDFNA
ncbi:MAG TPA: GTPase Era [Alphaproteobacteria bacterium]|nr:GTPase Era [Alphaproteobacteria bacterium]